MAVATQGDTGQPGSARDRSPIQALTRRNFVRLAAWIRRVRLGAAWLLVAAIVQGCAGMSPGAPPADLTFPPARDDFSVNGRLSARHGGEAVSARFNWQHHGDVDQLEFETPL